jgi:dihydrofolate reductase
MRNLFLYMTMTFDGFIAGPNDELDWMGTAAIQDPELNKDIVDLISRADTGLIGYPTASGMIPYWSNVAKNPSAPKGEHNIADVINKTHGIAISNKAEKFDLPNAELLVVKDDNELIEAVTKLKKKLGKSLGIPGGVRTAQTFARLGLVDEYDLLVHPIAIGNGKRLFTGKVNLELVSTKTYNSGIMRVCYRPR